MKKDEFLRKLHEIDSARQIKLVAMFNGNNIPQIAVTEARPGKDWEDMTIGYVTDLNRFKDEFSNLGEDDLFVMGRLPECDYRLGYDTVTNCFKKNSFGEENAKHYYMHNCLAVGELHCFVKKHDKSYLLYDCSIAGTSIVL